MKRIVMSCVAISLIVFSTVGCTHVIITRGVVSPNIEREIPTNAAIHVVVDRSVESEEEYDRIEIKRKLTQLLVEKGYTVTSEPDAEFIIHGTYETTPLFARRMLEMFSGPKSGVHTVRCEGPYDHKLSLWMVPNTARTGQSEMRAVWAGAAVLHGEQSASPKFLDVLLVAAIRHFPEDTGGTLEIKLGVESQEARRLRR